MERPRTPFRRGVETMTTALSVDPDISLQELLDINRSDQYSIQYQPFLLGPGGQLGGTIIRSAQPWKGLTKREGESFDDYQDRLAEVNDGVADGLGEARDMAMETAGSSGVAVIEQDGMHKVVSQSAAELAQAGDQGATVVAEGLRSYSEAYDEYVAVSGRQAHRPSIT